MKQFLRAFFIFSMLIGWSAAKADNTEFEESSNFMSNVAGDGVVHFKLLTFSEGGTRNHNIDDGYVWISYKNASGVQVRDTLFVIWKGDNHDYGDSEKIKARSYNTSYGDYFVTNIKNGSRTQLSTSTTEYTVTASSKGSWRVTYIECEWLLNNKVNDLDYELGIDLRDRARWYDEKRWYSLGHYHGPQAQQNPEVYQAVFYPIDPAGNSVVGKVAVPYAVYQKVYKYQTPWDNVVTTSNVQGGMVFAPAYDQVKTYDGIKFTVQYRNDSTRTEVLSSNTIRVPAYHTLRGFDVTTDYTDEDGINKGYRKLTWHVDSAAQQDVVAQDMFEIQRAYKGDFSDAESIGSVWYVQVDRDSLGDPNKDSTVYYTYIDSTMLRLPTGEKDNQVFYRVRRSSSSVWQWKTGNRYDARDTIARVGYLPGLFSSADQPLVTKTDHYDTDYGVQITAYMAAPGLTWWHDSHARLHIVRHASDGEEVDFIIPDTCIRYQKENEKWEISYVDYPSRSCVSYDYTLRMDTVGALRRLPFSSFHANKVNKDIDPQVSIKGVKLADQCDGFLHYDVPKIKITKTSDDVYANCIYLEWTIQNSGELLFDLVRTDATGKDTTLFEGRKMVGSYLDEHLKPGSEFRYKVRAYTDCYGLREATDSATIRTSKYGWVKGRVCYSNGMGMGNVSIELRGPDSTMHAQTDDKGYYQFEHIDCCQEPTLTIKPVDAYNTFAYGNGNDPLVVTRLDADQPYQTLLDFRNTSDVKVTGHVLYLNSTVPVRGAHFKLNGSLMHDRNGNVVETAADGSFSLIVPHGNITLQVVKEAHTFKNNGFFQVESKDTFSLSKNEYGWRMEDSTKVHLIGRISGGVNQGLLPLDELKSVNNLGDNLRFVLEPEGDNISQLVHYFNNQSIKEVYDTIYQSEDKKHFTAIHTTQERIEVTVDRLTGEFAADIFPIKYKITQMQAEGYASLFNEGQTSLTLDLMPARAVDTFRYIYHSPLNTTFCQMKYGSIAEDFVGVDKMYTYEASGAAPTEIPVAVKDADTIKYLFEHPLFVEGDYYMQITAHEDYYYNNDITGAHERVLMHDCPIKVYNSMVAETYTEEGVLNEKGVYMHHFVARNATFSLTDEDALRQIHASVLVDGQYVETTPLRGFVTGSRSKGKDYINELGSTLTPLDVIRDPYGANSYSYIEKGSTYTAHSKWTIDFTTGVSMNFNWGSGYSTITASVAAPAGLGSAVGVSIATSSTKGFSIPISTGGHFVNDYTYSFTTSDRIATSNSIYSVGSEADIYVGTENIVFTSQNECFRLIDEANYQRVKAAIQAGKVRVVKTGKDKKTDKNYYLVVAEEMSVGVKHGAHYAYSQAHILQNIVPELIRQRNALLVTAAPADTAALIAAYRASQKDLYLSLIDDVDSPDFGLKDKYIYYANAAKGSVDKVKQYNDMVYAWVMQVLNNENVKVNAPNIASETKIHDLDGNTSYSFSEQATYSYLFTSVWKGIGASQSNTGFSFPRGGELVNQSIVSQITQLVSGFVDKADGHGGVQGENKNYYQEVEVQVPGQKMVFTITPLADFKFDTDNSQTESKSRKFGYVLDPGSGNYLSQTVYRISDVAFEDWYTDVVDGAFHWITTSNKKNDKGAQPANYVFRANGGATSCPYIGGDSTVIFTPKTELSTPTKRLSVPTISIDKHEQSDIPEDGMAVFDLILANESEVDPSTYTITHTYKLKLDDASNPNGAILSIDGMVLSDGRIFVLPVGQKVHKTLCVKRGKGHDFTDLRLVLQSTCDIRDKAYTDFSVHFMPTSTDVHLTSPTNNWVMNTLSPKDENGYYLPILIEGFDVKHPNFDHIEFQYKLATDPDEKWVNQCSYYAEDSLYQLATGNKGRITNGRIANDIRFYGDRDPMEQEYDLRAVSFCRHGSGYITKSSAVLRGMKDTRVPELFGVPSPSDGILTFDKCIEIPFSEPIAGNYLDANNNFELLGVTNATGITSGTSLTFNGKGSSFAESKVGRSLYHKSFTIDMIVKPADVHRAQMFFSHGDSSEQVLLGMDAENHLIAQLGSNLAISSKIDDMNDFTRVVLVFDKEANNVLRFFVGNKEVTASAVQYDAFVGSQAPFHLGSTMNMRGLAPFEGRMLELRIWGKALTSDQITMTNMKTLTGFEQGLIAYYPMHEGRGRTVKDLANGANLVTHGLTWENPQGISLHFTKENNKGGVTLNPASFSRSKDQDMTLSFWFKQDDALSASDTATLFASSIKISIECKNLMVRFDKWSFNCGAIWDNEWHNIVLTLRRYNNVANIILDGQVVGEFDAHNIGDVVGTPHLAYSDGHPFYGYIGQIQLWEQALSTEFIDRFSASTPNGSEMGLLVYAPLHRMMDTGFGRQELVYTPMNAIIPSGMDSIPPFNLDTIVFGVEESMIDKDVYAPVRSKGELSNLNFKWVSQDSRLIVDLTMQDEEINKSTLYLTVRDVKDLRGNPMASPVSLNIYADRNRLRWQNRIVDINLPYGKDTVLTETIYNRCGSYTGYTITSLASWIEPEGDATGYINAAEEEHVGLFIKSSLDPGVYSTVVYLTDQSGLAEPLRVNLRVTTHQPSAWVVNPDKYNTVMSVVGEVKITEHGETLYDTDNEDLIAAFIDNRCVGVANNIYKDGLSRVFLNVHGTEMMQRKKVFFLLWRAKKGIIYNLKSNVDVVFSAGGTIGTTSPLVLTTVLENRIQSLELNSGWNWISLSVKTDENSDINNVLTSNELFRAGDQVKGLCHDYFADFSAMSPSAKWITLDDKVMDCKKAYMIHSAKAGVIYLQGGKLEDEDACYTVENGWNTLAYPFSTTQDVNDAMADYYNYASPGDVLRTYNEFAVFDETGRWVGSLTYMRPDVGYTLKRVSSSPASFCLQNNNYYNKPVKMPVIHAEHAGSMPIVACVSEATKLEPGDQLVLLNRTTGETAITEPIEIESRMFISAHAEDGDMLEARIVRNNEVVAGSTEPILYKADQVLGTPEKPYVIRFVESDVRKVIYEGRLYILRDGEYYNALGTKL